MELEIILDMNIFIILLYGVGFSYLLKVRLMDVIYFEFCRSVNVLFCCDV